MFNKKTNWAIFNAVRKSMHSRVRAVKAAGGTYETFLAIVTEACHQANQQFQKPLGDKEIKGIAKSIAKWTWTHVTPEHFSRIQSARANKRWKGHEKSRPWLAYGLTERTYWRRKAKDTLPSPLQQTNHS